MICQHCQQTIPDDSKFCPFCGQTTKAEPAQKTVEVKEPKKEKRSKSKIKIILFSLLGVVIVLVGVYLGTYFAARSKAQAGDFTSAHKLLLLPAVTELHDPKLNFFISAGEMFEKGDCIEAYKAFESLEKADYLNAADKRHDIKKQIYEEGIKLYRQEDIKINAIRYFSTIAPYLRSDDYLTLAKRNDYYAIRKLIGFEDANQVLLKFFPFEFLTGEWKTRDEKYYFSINEHGTTNYNLPHLTMEHSSYDMADGIFFLYKQDIDAITKVLGNYERINVFYFYIDDADTINIYCYKDRSTYTLYRQ